MSVTTMTFNPFPLLLILYTICIATPVAVIAADIEQEWVISYRLVHPDGVSKLVPVVNGQYPGPELRGTSGQSVKILVRNNMPTETTSIHWHGIKQTGTPWSDGVPGVTQCAIGPGESFLYEFTLDGPGTLWWHSHSGMQKSSLYGSIVVTGDEDQLPAYDDEHTLLLNDWFHNSATNLHAGLLDPNFRWTGDPQSLLINGKGTFNCSLTEKTCDPTHTDSGPFVLNVEPGKMYRLRLIGASSLAFLNFGIEKHTMQIVEAETTPLKPLDVKFLDVGSGQSYSVILRTKTVEQLKNVHKNNGNFWMQLNMRHRKTGPTAYAILRYDLESTEDYAPKRMPPPYPGRDDVGWSLDQARRLRSLHRVRLPRARRVFTLIGTQNRLVGSGRLAWSMNNLSYVDGDTPVLHAVKLGIKAETRKYRSEGLIPTPFNYSKTLQDNDMSIYAEATTHVIKVRKNEVVDFVFQNTLALNGAEEVHPWHLHLHNAWILGYGDHHSTWTPDETNYYEKHRAVSRNTFTLYPNSWTAIRVKMDNPGIANFHCHILPHLVMGMGFVVQVGKPDEIPEPPAGTQFCGAVSKLVGPPVRNPFVYGGCRA